MPLLLVCLAASTADAQESFKVVLPSRTQNPYINAIATLYEQGRFPEALSKLEKALDSESNGPQEVLWLKLMQGALRVELSQGEALEPFKEALALDKEAQLPVQGAPRRLRKLFAQARNTLGLPADKELLALDLEKAALASKATMAVPPPRRHGLSLGVRGEVDVLGLGPLSSAPLDMLLSSSTPAVSLCYTQQELGGALSVLVQPSPGLRAEVQFHPVTMGWMRPYARLGATTFFAESDVRGGLSFFGGASGRGALGVDVQFNSRMYFFADIAYERFFTTGERYKLDSVLFSVGVGLFP
ncbi:Branched-chain amino acid ABC transporter, amino acid-binding protein [Archangium gephyra]|uniref:Branched-chain amino acid ABC transporter, amino acid-binding protein n=1 Tax=Archangium gephyra TaxID=48 RepID=A0AAC8QCC8_9BACT|nr:Branched-chain amino acid ABC transporter, amino acid-binding protein [Archangium gephyra]